MMMSRKIPPPKAVVKASTKMPTGSMRRLCADMMPARANAKMPMKSASEAKVESIGEVLRKGQKDRSRQWKKSVPARDPVALSTLLPARFLLGLYRLCNCNAGGSMRWIFWYFGLVLLKTQSCKEDPRSASALNWLRDRAAAAADSAA